MSISFAKQQVMKSGAPEGSSEQLQVTSSSGKSIIWK